MLVYFTRNSKKNLYFQQKQWKEQACVSVEMEWIQFMCMSIEAAWRIRIPVLAIWQFWDDILVISGDLRNFRNSLTINWLVGSYPAGIYLLKVNNRNARTRCEICSKLTIMTPERRHWRRSGVFIVNFEHISHLGLVSLLLTLNM